MTAVLDRPMPRWKIRRQLRRRRPRKSCKKHARYIRAQRKAWRRAGLCTKCGRRRELPDFAWCERCRERHQAYQKRPDQRAKKRELANRERERRRRLGICRECLHPRAPGLVRCERCQDKKRRREAARRLKRRKARTDLR